MVFVEIDIKITNVIEKSKPIKTQIAIGNIVQNISGDTLQWLTWFMSLQVSFFWDNNLNVIFWSF